MSKPCDHRCCDYTHMRRPAVSVGQCPCDCHDGNCANKESHVGECSCPSDYYDWPHHYVMCPKGMAMIDARDSAQCSCDHERRQHGPGPYLRCHEKGCTCEGFVNGD